MVKVGLILSLSKEWLGGVNYFRNLLQAATKYGDGAHSFALIVPPRMDRSLLADFPPAVEVIEAPLLDHHTFSGVSSRLLRKVLGRDDLMAKFLRRHGIDVVTHYNAGARLPGIPVCSWIPDLQEKHLPEFFSEWELRSRDRGVRKLIKASDKIIFSSRAAADDFCAFYPGHEDLIEILHFVPMLTFQPVTSEEREELLAKYHLPEKFFFLPNQYWKHKNHKIVLEALCRLRAQGRDVQVVSTGNTVDYRVPGWFEKIQAFIREHELASSYHVLGLIPYGDVQKLAAICHAFINPSLFEGWSTTVEEAKYRGKMILLSDLKVHREQAPEYGVFFDPHDAEELAGKMWEMWQQPPPVSLVDYLERYNQSSQREFAMKYYRILNHL